jgi:hypothetical protein
MIPHETKSEPQGFDDRLLLDRLVDGELEEVDRRDLLQRLEAEPDGWRRCALAFLEAQSWREALAPLVAAAGAGPAATNRNRSRRRFREPVARWAGLAAALALTYVLGRSYRDGPQITQADRPAAFAPASQVHPSVPAVKPVPLDRVVARAPAAREVSQAPAADPLLERWQQRGYHTETQKRLVSMQLRDGRQFDVPVREIRLRRDSDRIY